VARASEFTRQRLLDAAVAACAEHGFEGVTVGDVAERAGVSAPAIYNHFEGKTDLLVAAGRDALDRLRPPDAAGLRPGDIARAFLAKDFASSRRLIVELHAAASRHPEVAALLATWHRENATQWRRRVPGSDQDAVVKTFFAVLLGLAQIDSLSGLRARAASVADIADDLVESLFADTRMVNQ
jgi:AcrR family transcriptional regulator